MDQNNPNNQQNQVVIRFMAGVNDQTVNLLITNIENKIREGKNNFLLLISSPGGFVAPGIAVFNYLKSLPINIETHNFGNVDSIASMLYCCGSKRTCSENASFLIHSVAWNGNGGFEEKRLKEFVKGLQVDRKNISEIIAKSCNKNQKQIQKIMFIGSHLDAEKAKKLGLVHEIKEPKINSGSEIISII